jgi:hypothetical protein
MATKLKSNLATSYASGTTSATSGSSNSLSLNPSQIASVIGAAEAALSNSNLSSSNDISQILPTLIQGAASGVGGLNLGNVTTESGLMSLIGNSSLASLIGQTGGTPSTSQIEALATSLFSNLGTSGISAGDLPNGASSIISQLLSGLSTNGISSSSLPSVIQSLASGAVQGLGVSGLSSSDLTPILQSLGGGSFSGLSTLASGLISSGSSNGSSSDLLTSLLNAFTSGSNSGLGNLSALLPAASASSGSNLLSSLLSGIAAASKNSGITGL